MEITAIFKYIADIFNIVPPNFTLVIAFWYLYRFIKQQEKQHGEIKAMFDARDEEHRVINKTIEVVQELNDARLEKGNRRFEKIESNVDQVYVIVLRDTIYNERLAIKDRLAAFNEYKRMGGNGYTDVYYETHLVALAQKQIDSEKLGEPNN